MALRLKNSLRFTKMTSSPGTSTAIYIGEPRHRSGTVACGKFDSKSFPSDSPATGLQTEKIAVYIWNIFPMSRIFSAKRAALPGRA
jgi:hypothetical protein